MRSQLFFAALLTGFLLPAPARAADEDVQVSQVAMRTLSARTILYREIETTIPQIGQVSAPIVEQLKRLVADKKVVFDGCMIFVYQGATGQPDDKFKLQVGIAVAEGTAAQGDFKVRRLEPLTAATVLYGGPILSIARAYEKVFGELGGKQPTGETREYYYNWEGSESKNNVEMIAVGVQ